MRRGDVHAHAQFDRNFVVVSTDILTEAGTVIVAEIAPEAPAGTRGMLAIALEDTEPVTGAVLAWRVNYMKAERLGKHLGTLSPHAMDMVGMALRTAMDL